MFAVLEAGQLLLPSCIGSVVLALSFAWPMMDRMFPSIPEKILVAVLLDELELGWLFLVLLSSWNLSAAPVLVSVKSS